MTTLQICLIVLGAVADEKQVSTYTECLRKMDALMRRQTTPVRGINKSLFFWLQRMSLISRKRFFFFFKETMENQTNQWSKI